MNCCCRKKCFIYLLEKSVAIKNISRVQIGDACFYTGRAQKNQISGDQIDRTSLI